MSRDNGRAQRRLDALASAPREEGAVPLDPRYLEAIDRLEKSEQSRPGADKTWVLATLRSSRRLLASARRMR